MLRVKKCNITFVSYMYQIRLSTFYCTYKKQLKSTVLLATVKHSVRGTKPGHKFNRLCPFALMTLQ